MTANAFFPTLFSPIDIGGVTLGNRIIHAAIVTQYVADGAPTERLLTTTVPARRAVPPLL